jgi:hypothetical protein
VGDCESEWINDDVGRETSIIDMCGMVDANDSNDEEGKQMGYIEGVSNVQQMKQEDLDRACMGVGLH